MSYYLGLNLGFTFFISYYDPYDWVSGKDKSRSGMVANKFLGKPFDLISYS